MHCAWPCGAGRGEWKRFATPGGGDSATCMRVVLIELENFTLWYWTCLRLTMATATQTPRFRRPTTTTGSRRRRRAAVLVISWYATAE